MKKQIDIKIPVQVSTTFMYFALLIQEADPSHGVITMFTMSSVHPSMPNIQNRVIQNNFQVRIMIAFARAMRLAKWIIDNTCLAYFFPIPDSTSCIPRPSGGGLRTWPTPSDVAASSWSSGSNPSCSCRRFGSSSPGWTSSTSWWRSGTR